MPLSLSGINAKCRECSCVFLWHLENAPFVDSEIVGTCSKCLQGEKHTCVDENTIPTITGIYPQGVGEA